jgi:hypothetical protein
MFSHRFLPASFSNYSCFRINIATGGRLGVVTGAFIFSKVLMLGGAYAGRGFLVHRKRNPLQKDLRISESLFSIHGKYVLQSLKEGTAQAGTPDHIRKVASYAYQGRSPPEVRSGLTEDTYSIA